MKCMYSMVTNTVEKIKMGTIIRGVLGINCSRNKVVLLAFHHYYKYLK